MSKMAKKVEEEEEEEEEEKEGLHRHIHGRRNAMWEFGAQHMKNCVYCVTRPRYIYKSRRTQKRAARLSLSALSLYLSLSPLSMRFSCRIVSVSLSLFFICTRECERPMCLILLFFFIFFILIFSLLLLWILRLLILSSLSLLLYLLFFFLVYLDLFISSFFCLFIFYFNLNPVYMIRSRIEEERERET